MSDLNPMQREAVRYLDGPVLVLAGAGSGKTRVITEKIAWLIRNNSIKANRIFAVTFTNKAAREMKERVSSLLSKNDTRGLTVSTFHTLGLKIIRQEKKHFGLRKGFSIFDAQDSVTLIKDLMHQEYDDDGDVSDLVKNKISTWKNGLINARRALALAKNDDEILAAKVYQAYDRRLRAYNAVDFDDLILLPCSLFKDHPEVLGRWRERLGYMLVDEYQDTNSAQYEMVKALVGRSGRLCVVGDDDQSIYSWRGARPENLVLLQEDYPNLKIIKLEQNYRSTGRILKAANAVIDNNPHVFEKRLWSELGFGDPVRVVRNKNEEQEADRITADILNMRLLKNWRFSEFAVLYRGNHQSRLLEIKMQALQIPYKVSGGTSFFSRTEIRDLLSYLRLIINPEDDNAFLRIVNIPRREIGSATLEKLAAYAAEAGQSLCNACEDIVVKNIVGVRSFDRLQEFSHWMDKVRRHCFEGDPINAIRELIEDMNYEGWVHQQSSSPTIAEYRMDNVRQLLKSIETMYNKTEEGEKDIESVINKLILFDLLDQEKDESDSVQLMTLHASKGLEYPRVYMMGVEEDILPHRTSVEDGTIEEERRLMYVGITRAQRNLTLSLCQNRTRYGEKTQCLQSRFIEEIPQEDIVWAGEGVEISAEENKNIGRAHISNLKELLSKT